MSPVIPFIVAAVGAVFTALGGFLLAGWRARRKLEAAERSQERAEAEAKAATRAAEERVRFAEQAAVEAREAKQSLEASLGLSRPAADPQTTVAELAASTRVEHVVLAGPEGLEYAGVGDPAVREELAALGPDLESLLEPGQTLLLRGSEGGTLQAARVRSRGTPSVMLALQPSGIAGSYAFARALLDLRDHDAPLVETPLLVPETPPELRWLTQAAGASWAVEPTPSDGALTRLVAFAQEMMRESTLPWLGSVALEWRHGDGVVVVTNPRAPVALGLRQGAVGAADIWRLEGLSSKRKAA
ncbi:MAG: hypothetical protein AAGF12_33910 [Myxococcota bacterium]